MPERTDEAGWAHPPPAPGRAPPGPPIRTVHDVPVQLGVDDIVTEGFEALHAGQKRKVLVDPSC